MTERLRSDRGSASVWAALSVVVLCGVFAAVLAFGQAVYVRHRAGAVADLAALAAADRALEGPGRACAAARRVARAQDARVVRCAVRGEIADLDAGVRWGAYTARVRSRAGPTDHPAARPAAHSATPAVARRAISVAARPVEGPSGEVRPLGGQA
ncbi:Rv3654c family TadE-like protein [Streptomyces sp. 891-h]|uniref:Rv3654c family TadE-like protein n=1 Tax=Streptomyces sp. 891-h TaxID=2720714 RepID=UPI001FA9CD83|nr:Rv3654c family TadE-like protein [Streptomyces sp. 891-h]UNZ18038.1 flp pilus-assembly TadE/G-like family protein [Streptomyces sp. 891-h]